MRVYQRAIDMNRTLAGVSGLIERKDRDLVRQLRRAASSVALNIAEGLGTQGGNRELRFQTALGSAREVQACLDVARAWGYLGAADAEARASVDSVAAMLFKLVRARR
jgi:four helix bundle protein